MRLSRRRCHDQVMQRFCQVSTRYAHAVVRTYGRDLDRALHDSPATVAAKVAQSEDSHGFVPLDWPAIGREEGCAGVDPGPPVDEVQPVRPWMIARRPLAPTSGRR